MKDEEYEVNRFIVQGSNLKNSEEHAFEVIKLNKIRALLGWKIYCLFVVLLIYLEIYWTNKRRVWNKFVVGKQSDWSFKRICFFLDENKLEKSTIMWRNFNSLKVNFNKILPDNRVMHWYTLLSF